MSLTLPSVILEMLLQPIRILYLIASYTSVSGLLAFILTWAIPNTSEARPAVTAPQ
jgi:hypothetical protein